MLSILFNEYTLPIRMKIREYMRRLKGMKRGKIQPERLRSLQYYLRKEIK